MIVYFSNISNFTHKFVQKLELPAARIPIKPGSDVPLSMEQDFVLITPTYGANGRDFVPRQVIRFLNNIENRTHLIGVIASGNLNFLDDYARAGDVIAQKCQVPLLYRFELAGTPEDVEKVQEGLDIFCRTS